MKSDKELINELNDLLDRFKKQASHKCKMYCEKDLLRLQGTFNQSLKKISHDKTKRPYAKINEPVLLEVISIIKNITKEIDAEATSIETEMHGVQNYSNYEYTKIMNFAYKKDLRETLINMLNLIIIERPELKEKEIYTY